MSKDLQTIPSDADFQERSKDLLAAFKFKESRKAGFSSVLTLAKKADLYLEKIDQGKTFYLVGFSKSKAQAHLCLAFMEEIRVSCSIDYILFANGRIIKKRIALNNVLSCFGHASAMSDHKQHCHHEHDAPMEAYAQKGAFKFSFDESGDPKDEEFVWRLPCRMLDGALSLSASEISEPLPAIQAAAEVRLANACPLFDLSGFKISPKPKKISKAKRYW